MFSRRPLFSSLLLSVPVAALLLGCTAKPENSPVIRKKFAEIDEMTKEVQETRNLLRGISGDLTVMQDQLSNLRALSPDGEGAVQVLQMLEDIEARIGRLETESTMIAQASSSGSRSTTTTPKPAETSAPAPKPAATTAAPAPKPAPKPAQTTVASARTTPRGSYHTFESGETLDQIARAAGITVEELRQANRLPSGARPLHGQRLFVPAKK